MKLTHVSTTMLSHKRGQLKILESIAVLIVFFFLVGMGINFYAKIQIQSLNAAKDEFKSLDATKISQKIIHMPELRCSIENTDQGSCIDLYQAKAWAATLTDADCASSGGLNDAHLCSERLGHYFEQIGVGQVVLTQLYSVDSYRQSLTDKNIVLYNYTINESAPNKATKIPVVIHDSITDTFDLGMLYVKVYE